MVADERVEVELAAGRLTALLQRYVPGLVSSLHLIGSAADGDFRPGRSDLDFVAVLSQPLSQSEIEALVIVHRLYASDPTLPPLDGIWLTGAELAAGPDACSDGPTTEGNQFLGLARGNRNPVTWHSVRECSLAILGTLQGSGIWHDPARLSFWLRENVEIHWASWHDRAASLLNPQGLAMLAPSAPMSGVLGISRIHHTLSTGRIASKTAAGEHALMAFDSRWHLIVKECLRIRRGGRGSLYRGPFRRRREALDFIGMAIRRIRADYRASE